MNDRELNLKLNLHMAEVCGLPIVEGEFILRDYVFPCVANFCGSRDYFLFVADANQNTPPWDPVHNMNQLRDYVWPALTAAGLKWGMESKYTVVQVWAGRPTGNDNSEIYVTPKHVGFDVAGRAFCEVAWEAYEAYEAWKPLQEKS